MALERIADAQDRIASSIENVSVDTAEILKTLELAKEKNGVDVYGTMLLGGSAGVATASQYLPQSGIAGRYKYGSVASSSGLHPSHPNAPTAQQQSGVSNTVVVKNAKKKGIFAK